MSWEVEYTQEFEAWWQEIDGEDQEQITAAVHILQDAGPGLRRPLVGSIEASHHANMKELIPAAGNIRILFAFDPRRAAILLLGGDKTNRWTQWYERNVPQADDLYDQHLRELESEGLLP